MGFITKTTNDMAHALRMEFFCLSSNMETKSIHMNDISRSYGSQFWAMYPKTLCIYLDNDAINESLKVMSATRREEIQACCKHHANFNIDDCTLLYLSIFQTRLHTFPTMQIIACYKFQTFSHHNFHRNKKLLNNF